MPLNENQFSLLDQSDDQWIKNWLEKEVSLMRELLSNLLQEETALMLWDQIKWDSVVLERSNILDSIKSLRELPKYIGPEKLQELLLSTWKNSECELDNLKEQLLALTEKTESQSARNQQLFKVYGNSLGKPLNSLYHTPLATSPSNNPRVRVTTLDRS